jgi:hypothetical protein
MMAKQERDKGAEAVSAPQRQLQLPEPSPPTVQAAGPLTGELPPHSVREIGGPKGPEPTRYGDWERNGRCIDF